MKENYHNEYGNELSIKIQFSDIDMMHVVHHSKYWIWFEESRFNFIKEILGISINDIITSNILIPLIDCSCAYINAIKWNMQIKVITKLEFKKSPYIVFHYEVYEDSDNN
jgi:acyl-CoA thioester hydrolase